MVATSSASTAPGAVHGLSGRVASNPRAGPDFHRALRQVAAERLFALIPFLGLALPLGIMASINPLALSGFGLQLLLAPAVVLVLVALAQMFVVGGGEVDLGVGSFASMVNVISATVLVARPGLGLAMLAEGLGGCALLAVPIRIRGVPAIVATLGAAFIWSGLGRTLQPSPVGAAPSWLRAAFAWDIPASPRRPP